MESQALSKSIVGLDAWLNTMRNEQGYCGPVAHWWQSCLFYSGAMADWRYEGIVCGYLNLYRTTSNSQWLDRALMAGEDLLRAQLPNGKFNNSSFEIGPVEGGTPHEAAVDVALLELATLLRQVGNERWRSFFRAAERNIKGYQLKSLWNGKAFLDQAWNQTVVPNKNATTMEALLLYQELGGESQEAQILGAAELILSAQVKAPGPRQGGCIHLGTAPYQLAIGIYTARCATALLRLFKRYPNEKYLRAAARMGTFLQRLVVEEGTIFGFYPDDRAIFCPTWISPSGDILRTLIELRSTAEISTIANFKIDDSIIEQLTRGLIEAQFPSGGMPTAYGLAHKGATTRYSGLPDFRDLLPVVGWCDKAFRVLTMLVSPQQLAARNEVTEPVETSLECVWKGRRALFQENKERIQLLDLASSPGSVAHKVIYFWRKGECYPLIYQI